VIPWSFNPVWFVEQMGTILRKRATKKEPLVHANIVAELEAGLLINRDRDTRRRAR